MPDFSEHSEMMKKLGEAQDAEKDLRDKVREAHLFVDKRDGQWEPYWWNANSGKPRYTFDMTNPIIDQIAGEMSQSEFSIKVQPAGGEATKDIAETYDGLIRNIETMSNATNIYNQAARSMVTSGMDGWRVVQKFVDSDSFDQDLVIEPISNFVDRVWFDPASELQDRSDSKFGFALQGLSQDEYKERYPEGSGMSVGSGRQNTAYFNQPDLVMVGEFYYIKEIDRELVLMSNGAVYEDDDDFKAVADDLEAIEVTEVKRRKRKKNVVFMRLFDANDWLGEEKETVFSFIPLIPTYGNFKIFENKVIYWGAVEKVTDSQRLLNYSMSREIEEGALAPRAKYWMTEKQAAGHEDTLETLNTNSDAVQYYNADAEVPPPGQQGGAQINQGLRVMSDAMQRMITQSAGLFAANMGDNPSLQSGVAIKSLQNKGDTGTIKYFKSQEVAICHTARILVDAIPKVYESQRQVRILREDGSFKMVTLNEQVIDNDTGDIVELEDLSVGKYDVTCSAGAAFKNRQEETVAAIIEMAQVDPSVIQAGGDILLGNVTAPGMDLLAARKRQQLLSQGLIPQEQMSEEELQQLQQQQAAAQQQQPDPAMLVGQAELLKAQNQQTQIQIDAQIKSAELQQAQEKQQIELLRLQQQGQSAQDKSQLDQVKLAQSQQSEEFKQLMQAQQQQMAQQQAIFDNINTQANTLKTLREAMGVDAIVGPHNTEAYVNQAVGVTEAQEAAGTDTSVGEGVAGTEIDQP